jgi:citrate lyase subunit beta / citryl-CoA lyase
MRSLLFVPGDSERKQAKARGTAADALILDLEDSVDVAQLPAARARVRELLVSQPDRAQQQLWVRVNSPSSGLLLEDLAAVMADAAEGGPDGIVLPKIFSPREIEMVAHYLAALEVRATRELGSTRLLVIATETPRGLLSLSGYPDQMTPGTAKRLAGLTWGSEDLGAALGVTARVDGSGALTPPFQLARTTCLLAAAALGVQALDSVYVDFRNKEGLARELDSARRDGFTGKLAIHPDQVDAINAAFMPTQAELAWARRVVAAFAAAPGAGVVSLDGQMIDRPHLVQAQRVLRDSPTAAV